MKIVRLLIPVIVTGVLVSALSLQADTETFEPIVKVDTDYSANFRSDFTKKLTAQVPSFEEVRVSDPTQSLDEDIETLFGATAVTDELQDFPHTFMYAGSTSSGWPFVGNLAKTGTCTNSPSTSCSMAIDCPSIASCNNPSYGAPPNAPINQAIVDAYARFPLSVLPPTPLSDGRPDILSALRTANPEGRVFAYVMGQTTWCPNDGNGNIGYPVGYYFRNYYLAATGGDPSCTTQSDSLLWAQDGILVSGDPHLLGINVNIAHRVQNPDSSYTYDVAEHIAETMYEHARPGRGFDGIYIDVFCPGIMWMETSTTKFDYARAGYGNDNTIAQNRTDFDLGWQAGIIRLATRLRELAVADGHPNYPISGNCGQSHPGLYASMNGWMRENYPYQNGGSFFSNILTYPWGYLHQEYGFRSPQINYIFTGSEPTTAPYSTLNQQKMRFGLASASLGNGYHAFEDGSAYVTLVDFYNWWYDEYGVDVTVPHTHPDFGRAQKSLEHSGWLGQPTSDMYQMIFPNYTTSPDKLTVNQSFENASGTPTTFPGWFFTAFNPGIGTIAQDTTTAVTGSASARVSVTGNTGAQNYFVNVSAFGQNFSVTNGQQYAITFWAKASARRPVDVVLSGTGVLVVQTLSISTEWRQYQAILRSNGSASNTNIRFDLAGSLGDIWFDDVHVQTNASSVYRRDFERGIVLVNPSDVALTVALEKPYRKILGTVTPTINNGATVSSVTLTPTPIWQGIGDAIFLLTFDATAPGTVTDLVAGSP